MSDENKTEDATPKRMRDAREKGQIAKSADLNAATSLLVFTLLLGTIFTYILQNALLLFNKLFAISNNYENFNPSQLFMTSITHYFIMFLPVALVAMVVGVVSNLIQVGFLFTTDPLKPDFKKLNPIEGFKNIFSKKALFTLVKNLAKLILVFYMAFSNISNSLNKLLNSGNIATEQLLFFFLDFVKEVSLDIAAIMFVLAVVDYTYERYDHKKNMRMSQQEIKDEYKEMEGSPEIKSARQQRQRELAMGRMMENVEDATAVVTNPTHIAVAIRYDKEKDQVPIVLAKGRDILAEKIRDRARENEIPIVENKPLARTIYKNLEVGDYVPEELYQAIAEILVIVYKMEEEKKRKI